MLSPGDGIALASVAGIVIVGILRLAGGKNLNCNGITRKECDIRTASFNSELKHIRVQLNEIDKFLRESK